jgi:F-type H+-transporting ATPase subunit delta
MSLDVKIVKDYAESLLAGVDGVSKQEKLLAQMVAFDEILQSSDVIRRSLYSPIIDRSAKVRLVDAIVERYKFEKIFNQFLRVLIKNARCNLLPQITKSVKKLISDAKGIKLVEVVSAYDLPKKSQQNMQEFLEKKIGSKLEATFTTDASIIGGVVIKYDSNLIDCSVEAGLRKIENIVAKIRV